MSTAARTNTCFVFDGIRTPRGKASVRGALATIAPVNLAVHLLEALAQRHSCSAVDSEDVILGCATQVNGQGANIARTASLLAGWHTDVGGMTVNRFCASGLDAVNVAAARIQSGGADLLVAGGVESVSQVPMFSDNGPLYGDANVMRAVHTVHMGIAADAVATAEKLQRHELDAYAVTTRHKARVAMDSGVLRADVIPVGNLLHDEFLAFAPSAQEMAALPPAYAQMGADGQDAVVLARHPHLRRIEHLHTKATTPPPADGAALVLLGSARAGERHHLVPRARVVAVANAGCDPVLMLTAGQSAIDKVLVRAGLRAADIAVFEFAEAFAALCVRLQRHLDIDHDRLNIFGGTLAGGHAFGATGAVLVVHLLRALDACKGRYGVAAVSGAAGVGTALLIERL